MRRRVDDAGSRLHERNMLPNTGFGKRTTAEEVARGLSLSGRRAIVTGGAAGLGLETARVLASIGADVTIACRSVAAGETAAKQARETLGAGAGRLHVVALDLTAPASIREFAQGQTDAVDLLINNAGVMATPLGFTAQGYEMQMGTNHLGHFLLTTLLLGKLAPEARVVNVSSKLHTRGSKAGVLATLEGDRKYESRTYSPFEAYGDSKLANILFTKALALRLPTGASTFSLHPGVIPTNLSRHMLGGALFRVVGSLFMKSIASGAATTVFAATAPRLGEHSGIYLSDCNEAQPSPAAMDRDVAEQVWRLSESRVSA